MKKGKASFNPVHDEATKQGIAHALRDAYSELDLAHDERMKRLLAEMDTFIEQKKD